MLAPNSNLKAGVLDDLAFWGEEGEAFQGAGQQQQQQQQQQFTKFLTRNIWPTSEMVNLLQPAS